jgi:hypothetical protein
VSTATDFDVVALHVALDHRRRAEELSWPGVARALWAQSAVLNERRGDHPISAATVTSMLRRGDTTCQHALFMLRWLDRAPEDFIADPVAGTRAPLPAADAAHRPRWNLERLYAALDAARTRREATWKQAAAHLDCTPSQLTGLRRARFAIGMRLAMRICQSLKRPATTFIDVASW